MHETRSETFYGWRVVGATFVLAVFGLGVGFHGPAVYLHAVHERTGWPLALISTAVTVHFLVGAVVVANLPALHRRFGIPAVTKAGAILLAAGVFGWAIAAAPWQLFIATLLSGAGWVTMGVAAINAISHPGSTAPAPQRSPWPTMAAISAAWCFLRSGPLRSRRSDFRSPRQSSAS
jgi:uncharacterized membrane protein